MRLHGCRFSPRATSPLTNENITRTIVGGKAVVNGEVRGMRGQPQIDVEGWRRRLTEAGIGPTLAAALAEMVRPSIALLPGAAAADSALLVSSTRLGGSPDLPASMPWPVRRPYRLVVPRGNRTPMQRERPLAFLAQIAMSDATAVGGTV